MKKVIIDNIEKKLNERLSIFTFKGEREFVVRRESHGQWETLVVLSETNLPFSAVIIESVQGVLKPYLRKYIRICITVLTRRMCGARSRSE